MAMAPQPKSRDPKKDDRGLHKLELQQKLAQLYFLA